MTVLFLLARADCDAPCFEQLKATHLRASPKQQALLDVLLQMIKTWPLTIGPWLPLSISKQININQGPIVSGYVFICWSNTSNSACCFGDVLRCVAFRRSKHGASQSALVFYNHILSSLLNCYNFLGFFQLFCDAFSAKSVTKEKDCAKKVKNSHDS